MKMFTDVFTVLYSRALSLVVLQSSDMSFYQTGLKQHHALQHADPLTFGENNKE